MPGSKQFKDPCTVCNGKAACARCRRGYYCMRSVKCVVCTYCGGSGVEPATVIVAIDHTDEVKP